MPQNPSNTPLSPMEASATARRSKEVTHEYMIEFTPEELKRSKIHVVARGIDKNSFDDKGLPSDIHLVQYKVAGQIYTDVVRAYTKVDIFDEYYQKVKNINGEFVSIENGYGNVRPNLYGKIGKTKES